MRHLKKMVLSGVALSVLAGGGRLPLLRKWLPTN